MGKKFKNIEKLDNSLFVMSLNEFINDYLDNGTDLNNKKLTHKNFKEFQNPYVVSISFDYVNRNLELVWNGVIFLVKDAKGNLGCYLNPDELKRATEYFEVKEKIKKLRFKSFEEILPYYRLFESFEPVIDVLKDNGKFYKLKEAKNAIDKENSLYETGVFSNKVLVYNSLNY